MHGALLVAIGAHGFTVDLIIPVPYHNMTSESMEGRSQRIELPC